MRFLDNMPVTEPHAAHAAESIGEEGTGMASAEPVSAKPAAGSGRGHSRQEMIDVGRRVVDVEGKAIRALLPRIGDDFVRAVDLIYYCRGRVVVTGIGKSGIIGKKIAATLSSTGTPAIFLNSAEGLHGDLGVVLQEDLVICISKSGNGEEMRLLLPLFRKLGVPIIAMTGNLQSDLANHADVVLDISVDEEACPFDLAPTASSTATLVMGDALAIALLTRRDFSLEDFAIRHPGGTLGRRLLLRVEDVMGKDERVPRVLADAGLDEIIFEISEKRYGATCVVDENDRLFGIITDGDLRRFLQKGADFKTITAAQIMTPDPKTIPGGVLSVKALEVLEDHNILQIVVVDAQKRPIGIIHLHDLLKAGVV